MTRRLKKITGFLVDYDKEYKLVKWENGEGYDIEVEDIIISVPDDFEKIISFEAKVKNEPR